VKKYRYSRRPKPWRECWWCPRLTGSRHGNISSSAAHTGNASRKSCGRSCEGSQGETRTSSRSGPRGRFAGELCSQPTLDFFSTTAVGKQVLAPAWEDTQREVSEWELREREEEKRQEDEERTLFLSAPAFVASAEKEWDVGRLTFVLSFVSPL